MSPVATGILGGLAVMSTLTLVWTHLRDRADARRARGAWRKGDR